MTKQDRAPKITTGGIPLNPTTEEGMTEERDLLADHARKVADKTNAGWILRSEWNNFLWETNTYQRISWLEPPR